MRRRIAIATFVLLLASMPVFGQRGGGHGSSGGHSGISHGSMGSHVGGGRSFGGGHAFSGARSMPHGGARSFNRGTFHQPGFNGNRFRGNRFSNNRIHLRTVPRNCIGCRRFGYPYWGYSGFYDPYWWWDHGSSYDEDYAREREYADQMNQQSLEEQRMRRGEDQDLYAQRQQADPAPRGDVQAEAYAPATVLVFRDQHKQEVQNYAIVGTTLWTFSPQRQKIALADLDVSATQKANEERGVDFRMPQADEGQ